MTGKMLVLAVLISALAGPPAGESGEQASGRTQYPYGTPAKLAGELDKFWLHAKKEVYRSVPVLLAQDQVELRRGLKYHKLMRGPTKGKLIALTFDDGPHPQYTPQILSLLRKYNAKATFFVVGEMAERNADLVKAEIAEGHDVANHTYHHVNLTRIPPEYVATEIDACGDVLQSITGKRPRLFRPPGGDYDREVAEVAEALNYTMVLWTDDPGDYASPGGSVIESRTLRRVSPGGIILIHDGVQQTIDILPDLLRRLKKDGFKFVTVSEMIERAGAGRRGTKAPVNP
jgi:peptidoglycan/xylan/chitin deacetylase (PgdA/CDA1 family)